MYVGRIVAAGRTLGGELAAMYRVSSRSFPNREAKILEGVVSVLPKAGYETDIQRNPYIAYNCLRLTGDYAVATNGAQTDPIAEKLAAGMSGRDALTTVLFAMDYEHDDYNTPRIAAVVSRASGTATLGIVRHDAVVVREFDLPPGRVYYVCTYEHNVPCEDYSDDGFDVCCAESACAYVLGHGVFSQLERPITAACAVTESGGDFGIAVADAPRPDA